MRAVALSVLGLLLVATGAGSAAQAVWQDTVPVSGSTISTVSVAAPVLTCDPVSLGTVTIRWDKVPGATGYRLVDTFLIGPKEVDADTTSQTYYVLGAGELTVQALFGPWQSASSNSVPWAVLVVGISADCG